LTDTADPDCRHHVYFGMERDRSAEVPR